MPRRQVHRPLASYRDADGSWRHALAGENVDVHEDFLASFDAINDPTGSHAPKRVGGTPPKKAARKA